RPALVVVITVDQLRPDYLVRYRSQLQGGLARLLERGAVFEHAHQDHAITETAVGHATLLAGRHPARHGIIRNDAGVQDSTSPLVNATIGGASPFRFRGTGLMDWLKVRDLRSRGLSVSLKDRGAILPLGRAREQAYWYGGTGEMITSTYYAEAWPGWVRAFNARGLSAQAREWDLLLAPEAYAEPDSAPWEVPGRSPVFPHRLAAGADARRLLIATPFGDEYLLAFALEGVQRLDLGRGPAPDLLAVSLSATDVIGHAFGPDSREIHDQVLRLDRALGTFLDSLYRLRDSTRILVALTADHGVTSIPERTVAVGHGPAERVSFDAFAYRMDSALVARLGPAPAGRRWVEIDNGLVLLERRALAARGVSPDSLASAWVREVRAHRAVLRVDTRRTIAAADTARDAIARRWRHLLPPEIEIAALITLRPGSVWAATIPAMHGSPHDPDAAVPLLLMGPGVRAGRYPARVGVVDLAPTLARLLDVPPLERLDGRVLTEALQPTR
ncbi:MAG: alkaline phosphatase family protein, partial [Gemmatimonadales bacterium]